MEWWIESTRAAFRSLCRTPGFAVTAVSTLALGIGLSVAVFTVAEALLLRKLPYRDQDRLVVLWGQPADRSFAAWPFELTYAREFARGSSLERAAFFAYEGAWPQAIRDGERMTRLRQALVSGDFFAVLDAAPIRGRALRPGDDVVGAPPVVVLSHGAWQRHFGGSDDAVGRQILLHGNSKAYTIVGVMPLGFDYPAGTDYWAPLVPGRARPGDTDSVFAHVHVLARLRAGASPVITRDELTAFYRRTGTSDRSRSLQGVVNPLPRLILGDTRPAVLAFAVAALLLLVITCVNVANLLLVRGLIRMREIAVRSALGAARGRVAAQLLVENAVLAAAGGVLGAGVAWAAVSSFVTLAPAGIPRMAEIQLNAVVLVGALLITAGAMLLFGLAPAILGARVDPQQVLRSGSRQSMSRGFRLASEGLVVGQVALAALVLSAAGLVVRSTLNLEQAELAFEPSRLLIGELAFRYDQVDTRDQQLALLDRILPEVRAIPGVEAVSPVVAIPFSGPGGWDLAAFAAEGRPADAASSGPTLNLEVVVPEYFRTFGIEIVEGRGFTDQDREGAPTVLVISRSTARFHWPGESAIGKRVSMGRELLSATVVGVVPDTRYRDLREARPAVYFPLRQSPFPFAPLTLAIRTTGAPAELVPALRRTLASVDPGIALADAAPFERYLDRPLAQPRLNALLLTVFAIAAMTLAAVGLFGVMATVVGQRTREFGVRMALGATGEMLRRMVMGRGVAIASAGLAAGLLGALLANRLLGSLLYEVSPTDGVTLSVVAILLFIVAALASVVPARASTRIDPAHALRAE